MAEQTKLKRLNNENWFAIDPEIRSRYLAENQSKADCSFLIKDPNNENSQKILKSFQWILSDVSIYFRIMFSSKSSNRKEIPIDDPYFEDILSYIHTKTVPLALFKMKAYEKARVYEIYNLVSDIGDAILKRKYPPMYEWIDLEIIFKYNWDFHFGMEKLLEMLIPMGQDELKAYIETKMYKIITFDVDLFQSFMSFLSLLYCYNGMDTNRSVTEVFNLKIIEIYAEKNPLYAEYVKKENAFELLLLSQYKESSKLDNQEFIYKYPKISEILGLKAVKNETSS